MQSHFDGALRDPETCRTHVHRQLLELSQHEYLAQFGPEFTQRTHHLLKQLATVCGLFGVEHRVDHRLFDAEHPTSCDAFVFETFVPDHAEEPRRQAGQPAKAFELEDQRAHRVRHGVVGVGRAAAHLRREATQVGLRAAQQR